ncbi:MAG TPA: SirB2 family protein, partial [Rhodocyclaceae bacterium]|nr:SirB2 family protein [Rhodocyclaceae bacterium]
MMRVDRRSRAAGCMSSLAALFAVLLAASFAALLAASFAGEAVSSMCAFLSSRSARRRCRASRSCNVELPPPAMSYLALRHLHISCALLSIALFSLRAGLLLAGRGVPRTLRWLPHVNDTVLLAAAIVLAVWSGQYPLQQPW